MGVRWPPHPTPTINPNNPSAFTSADTQKVSSDLKVSVGGHLSTLLSLALPPSQPPQSGYLLTLSTFSDGTFSGTCT